MDGFELSGTEPTPPPGFQVRVEGDHLHTRWGPHAIKDFKGDRQGVADLTHYVENLLQHHQLDHTRACILLEGLRQWRSGLEGNDAEAVAATVDGLAARLSSEFSIAQDTPSAGSAWRSERTALEALRSNKPGAYALVSRGKDWDLLVKMPGKNFFKTVLFKIGGHWMLTAKGMQTQEFSSLEEALGALREHLQVEVLRLVKNPLPIENEGIDAVLEEQGWVATPSSKPGQFVFWYVDERGRTHQRTFSLQEEGGKETIVLHGRPGQPKSQFRFFEELYLFLRKGQ